MKTLSLRIDDATFGETEKILANISISRNKYINDAISYYNKVQLREILENKLSIESAFVKNESMRVLKDFEHTDYTD